MVVVGTERVECVEERTEVRRRCSILLLYVCMLYVNEVTYNISARMQLSREPKSIVYVVTHFATHP